MSSTSNRGGFWRGFGYAARGVWLCLRRERNFRFHLAVTAYVLAFAPYFSLSPVEWAVLCLTFGSVLCAELVNSAVERAVDRISEEKHPLSAAAKDLAAGAVLVSAVIAAVVGLIFFLRPSVWLMIFEQWKTAWWRPCILVLSFVPAWLFVFKRR
jgi:diacylglycerol kinase